MAYSKILLLYILIRLLCLTTIKAQDNPTFSYSNCSNDRTTANSTFQVNLRTLFSSMSSKSMEFYNTTVTGINPSDSVYGLFMCRGDVPSQLCHECVGNATKTISLDSACSLSKEAVIWYEECMVRYSNKYFFSTVTTSPGVFWWNNANVSNASSFKPLLSSTMKQTADEAARPLTGDKIKKFATKENPVTKLQTLYCLAQCTPDLSAKDCRTCLSSAIGHIPQCCDGKQGGRVLFPSCNIRYELYPFYKSANASSTNGPETNDSKQDAGKLTIIFIVVPTTVLVMLISIGYYLLAKKMGRKSRRTILQENFGEESATLEPLQFDWLVIEAATNNFSEDNYIGKGGFGEVYKLRDYQYIISHESFVNATTIFLGCKLDVMKTMIMKAIG